MSTQHDNKMKFPSLRREGNDGKEAEREASADSKRELAEFSESSVKVSSMAMTYFDQFICMTRRNWQLQVHYWKGTLVCTE
jgi:hypothetical protein